MMIEAGPDHDGYYEWLEAHGGKIVQWRGSSYVDLAIPCSHFVGGKCAIYARRPAMCQQYFCDPAVLE
jgi:Fe-S-cluster containining protein